MKPVAGLQLAVIPGKAAEGIEVIADCVGKSFELYVRVRAFFYTLALVSITKPLWFPLQAAMQASEHVLTFITDEYDGRTPPVRFLVEAWAGTIHYFSENIRMTKRSAKDVIGNIGGWENRWKWSPSSGSNGSTGGGQMVAREPDNLNLRNQLHAMQGQCTMYQKQVAAMQRAAAAATGESNYQRRGGDQPQAPQE